MFTRSSADGTFTPQAKLHANDAAVGDNFGISVSLYGDTALIGARGDDDNGLSDSGSVYVFKAPPPPPLPPPPSPPSAHAASACDGPPIRTGRKDFRRVAGYTQAAALTQGTGTGNRAAVALANAVGPRQGHGRD